jgi:hypothetical protein
VIEKTYTWEYDDGYCIGWDAGRQAGLVEGYNEAVADYEPRLAKYWTEMVTLNARISYLERLTGGTNEKSEA